MSGLAKKHQKLSRKFISLVFVGCLLFVQIIVPVASVNAIQANPSDQLERWLYYRGMRACFYNPWFGVDVSDDESISASDINNGKLSIKSFEGISTQQKKGFGYLAPGMDGGDDNDGTVNCTDGSIFVRGAKLFGFDNPMKLICAMNRALGSGEGSRIKPSDPIDCERSEKIEFDGGGGDVFQRALTKALESEGSKDRPAFDINNNNGPDYSYKSLLYLIGKRSLEVFCGSNKTIESTGTGSGNVSNKDIVSIDIVKSDGTIDKSKNYPLGNPDRDEDSLVDDIYYDQGGDANNAKDLRCHEMAKMTRDNSADYKTWVKKHPEDAKKNENTAAAAGNSSSSSTDEKTSCAIDGLGWIICPVFNVLAKMVDETYTIVEDMLVVQPLTTTGASQGLYESWQAMRNIANVAFIIAFLVVIYTQITGASQGSGMFSNYGVKKLLPRIILAAILVNSSYWLCAIMIDVSNITGASLRGLLTDSQGSILASPQFSSNFSSDGGGWQGIVGPVLAFSLVGVGSYLALGSIIILLPTVLLAIVTAFLVLTLRQALIIVLVALAPFAFVAYLLPNTQEWFKRWFDLFKTMLLMYPLIAVIFGGSALASHIIMNSRPDSWTIQLMGASVAIIPLAITPVIMKTAGGLLNRFGGIVNNPNRGPIDALRKRAEATAGRIKNNRDIRAMDRPSWRSLRGAGLRSEMKRDQIQKRRDAKYQGLAYQGSAQGYTKRAHDEEKETKRQENEFEERDIQGQLDHMGLHADIRGRLLDSEFGRKVAEDTERGRREEAHMMNNRNAYQQMYDATQNRDAMRQESENEFGRTDLGRRVAQRSKVAGGDKAITEGEHEEAYLNSPDGTQQSRGKKLVDDAVKQREGELETLYLQDEEGRQARTQQLTANKRSTDEAKAVEGQAEIGYLRSDEGAAARAETIRIDTDAQTEQLNVRNAQTGSTVGRAQAQELKRVQGAEKIIGKEAEAAYAASAIGQVQNQVEAELGLEVGKRQARVNADAGTAFATSAQGEALTVQAAAAESSRAAADKTTEALVSELKTEKGIENTTKRLEFIYPNKHTLAIKEIENYFHIHLEIELT